MNMDHLDWATFHLLNELAGRRPWLDALGKWAATQLAVVLVATFVLGWLVVAARQILREHKMARTMCTVLAAVGLTLALGLVADQVIGWAWFRSRPYASHAHAHLLTKPSSDPSFPSDHATGAFAITFGSFAALPRLALLLLGESILMSVARVYVGLHYPGDILGSVLVGGGAALLVSFALRLAGGAIDWTVTTFNSLAGQRGWRLRVE
jgi:undecaprenyl-diphosphatase